MVPVRGGTAAIYYGLKLDADKIIAGAPQYYIGDYLNTEKHRNILNGMMGKITEESIHTLNTVVSDMIFEKRGSDVSIILHYSKVEHTYSEHIRFLVAELEKYGYNVEKDEKDYENHSDVALYFPQLLKRKI